MLTLAKSQRAIAIGLLVWGLLTASGFSASPKKVYAVFRNDSKSEVKIKIEWPEGYSSFGLSPGRVFTEYVSLRGKLMITMLTGGSFTRPVLVKQSEVDKNIDPRHNAFYFRITDQGVQMLSPKDAHGWWAAGLLLGK